MMQRTEIECPLCKEKVWELLFWKASRNKHYHLCEKCSKRPVLSEDDVLAIGFEHGYQEALEDAKRLINKLK